MDHILKMCTYTFYGSYKVTFVYFTTYNSVLNFYGGMSLKGQINKKKLIAVLLTIAINYNNRNIKMSATERKVHEQESSGTAIIIKFKSA